MEGGGGARGTNNGDEQEDAGRGASRYADQHGQSIRLMRGESQCAEWK